MSFLSFFTDIVPRELQNSRLDMHTKKRDYIWRPTLGMHCMMPSYSFNFIESRPYSSGYSTVYPRMNLWFRSISWLALCVQLVVAELSSMRCSKVSAIYDVKCLFHSAEPPLSQ